MNVKTETTRKARPASRKSTSPAKPGAKPSEVGRAATGPNEAEPASDWKFNVPALCGIQGGRSYYAVTMPYRVLARLLQIDTGFKAVERAQRLVQASRVQQLKKYMSRDGYALPALTGCVVGQCEFIPSDVSILGKLAIDMGAKVLLADGQHRASAIVAKLAENPNIGHQSVIVQLYTDLDLAARQQLFSDLNSHVVKPNASINNLYNHKRDDAQVAKAIGEAVFPDLIDYERVTCSAKGKFLYPFKSLIDANNVLFGGISGGQWTAQAKLDALQLWGAVVKQLPDLSDGEALADVKDNSVLGTAAGLMVLAWVTKALLEQYGQEGLAKLQEVDWSRQWEGWQGYVMSGDRMVKNGKSVREGARQVLRALGVPTATIAN